MSRFAKLSALGINLPCRDLYDRLEKVCRAFEWLGDKMEAMICWVRGNQLGLRCAPLKSCRRLSYTSPY